MTCFDIMTNLVPIKKLPVISSCIVSDDDLLDVLDDDLLGDLDGDPEQVWNKLGTQQTMFIITH